jgi:hypothetical protein
MSDRPTIYVHVGLPKTGTTFLQDLMREHADALAAEGLRYPLVGAPDHFLAALDARGNVSFAGVQRPQAEGAWSALVARAAAAPDRAVISHEVLATADGTHARAAMRLLEPYDTHVVVTARDPARQVVADWQESVKHGRWQNFDTYVRRGGVGGGKSAKKGAGSFQAQRLPQVLRRWGRSLPADHVHLVTVPPPGTDPGLLWERFAGVLGVSDPGRFRPSSAVRRNERLGVVEIELMRRVNRVLRDRVDRSVRTTLTKDVYAQTVLPRVSSSPAPVLPVDLRPRLDAIAQQWIDDISERGYDVQGDLQDLVPRHVDGPSPTDWTDAELVGTSVAATAELLAEIGLLREEVSGLRRRLDRLSPRGVGRRVKRRLTLPH